MKSKREFSSGPLIMIAVIDILAGVSFAVCAMWGASGAASFGAPFIIGMASAVTLLATGGGMLIWVRSKTKRG